MTTQVTPCESTPSRRATLSYIAPNGEMSEILLNLKKDADNVRMQKTIYWAMINSVEIRIRPTI